MTSIQNPDPQNPLAELTGTWQLDTSATTVKLRTKAMWGLANVKGSVTALEGVGRVMPDGSVTGTLVMDAASVNTAQAKRDKHLRSKDFFDVEAHPSFTYTATSAQAQPDGSVTIAGSFTARGQTHPLAVHGTVKVIGHDAVTVIGEADLNRGEWGMTWAKLGAGVHIHLIVAAAFTRS